MHLQHRREFLKFMGKSTIGLSLAGPIFEDLAKAATPSTATLPFSPISPNLQDDLLLAKGFKYKILLRAGDPLTTKGEKFGYNNDYNQFLPIRENLAWMWTNHESIEPLLFSNWHEGDVKTIETVKKEQAAVGGSLYRISRKDKNSSWELAKDRSGNRRYDGNTKIPFSGGVKIKGSGFAKGTLANCAGGKTPLGALSQLRGKLQRFLPVRRSTMPKEKNRTSPPGPGNPGKEARLALQNTMGG